MRRIRGFVILALVASVSTAGASHSTSLRFQSLTVDDGLPQSHVSAMARAPTGRLWFGTIRGVGGYDGQSFELLEDDSGPFLGEVRDLHAGADGRLWVATRRSILRRNATSGLLEPVYRIGPLPPDVDVWIHSLVTTPEGELFFVEAETLRGAAQRRDVKRLDPGTGAISAATLEGTDSFPRSVALGGDGRLWVAAEGLKRPEDGERPHGILELDRETMTLIPVVGAPPTCGRLAWDESAGALWAACRDAGVVRYQPGTGVWRSWRVSAGPWERDGEQPTDLVIGSDASVWTVLSTSARDDPGERRGGVLVRIGAEGELERFDPVPWSGDDLSGLDPRSILLDPQGVLWIGTSGSGVRFTSTLRRGMETFHLQPGRRNSLGDPFVRAVWLEGEDRIWVGTLNGLDLVDRAARTVEHFVHDPRDPTSLAAPRVTALARYDGELWVGTERGVQRFDPETGGFRRWREATDSSGRLRRVVSLVGLEPGELWVVLENVVDVLDTATGQARNVPALTDVARAYLGAIGEGDDTLWLASQRGAYRFDVRSEQIVERVVPGCGATEAEVSALWRWPHDPRDLWVVPSGEGVCRYDRSTGEWGERLLPGVSVFSLAGDDSGMLWVGSGQGLIRLDPTTGRSVTYGPEVGAQSLEYNARAVHIGDSGELAFGGVAGLNVFRPGDLPASFEPPEADVVSITILEPGLDSLEGSEVPYERRQSTLKLIPGQTGLRFDFGVADLSLARRARYRIQLVGRDDSWVDVGGLREATYTGLPPGQYTFRVQAALEEGTWGPTAEAVAIRVRAPFWRRGWFLALCGLLVLAWIARALVARERRKREQRRELQREVAKRTEQLERTLGVVRSQATRLEDLDRAKTEFFANVSHELRSPLTVIQTAVEELAEESPPSASSGHLPRVRRSIDRLLDLVNQILDTARIESGMMRVELLRHDLVEILRQQVDDVGVLAEVKGISLLLEAPAEPLNAKVDREKMGQVFGNLLTNALKFSPEGGQVVVTARGEPQSSQILVEVRDSGPGILEEDRGRVFERYFTGSGLLPRTTPSTGIGLALARDLVELHQGRIWVRSEPGEGATFGVVLPADGASLAPASVGSTEDDRAAHESESIAELEASDDIEGMENTEEVRATLLVVDDDEDIREIVARLFTPEYLVLTAEDGERALAIARGSLPDLVVTDVRMPGMDGFELCRAIRDDEELKATAVLLLTARSEVEDIVAGLEQGADDYLVKPFARRELRARVQSLFAARQRLRHALRGESLPPLAAVPDTPEERLLQRVKACIEEHLHDDEFTVDQLARHVAMSRVHLYRRLQAAGNTTPSQLIFEMRLARARRLLREGEGSVSEVAYGVGFKSLSHFSRKFKQEFGCPPSEYAARSQRHASRLHGENRAGDREESGGVPAMP